MTRLRRTSVTLVGMTALGLALWIGFDRSVPVASQDGSTANDSAGADHRRSLPSLTDRPSTPVAAPAATVDAETVVAGRVDLLMKEWRTAIINKNPDTVQSLDGAFASYPRTFIPALMVSAETDSEERVRSFSTRVLGKLRSAESVALMRKLLADKSEYVRFNAAWALGELADRGAVSHLRQMERRDPSSMVRQSASASLRKLEGG